MTGFPKITDEPLRPNKWFVAVLYLSKMNAKLL